MQAVQEQQSLTREQKEAVGLLSIGTFLEYFDLMLYVTPVRDKDWMNTGWI